MQKKQVLSVYLLSVLLSVMVALSGVLCVQDCFDIPCDLTTVFAACTAFSLLIAACVRIKRIWIPFLLTVALCAAAGYYFREALWLQLNGALYAITHSFSLAFSQLQPIGTPNVDCTLLLSCLTLPLVWICAWTVSREGSCVPILFCCVPILIVCLIIVDFAPIFWLVVLTAALFLLVITNHVRERNPAEGSVLAWWLFLPTAILFFALTFLWPPAAYVREERMETLRLQAEKTLQIVSSEEPITASISRWNRSLKKVDLRKLGPKVMTGTPVLEYALPRRSLICAVSLWVFMMTTVGAPFLPISMPRKNLRRNLCCKCRARIQKRQKSAL